MRAEAADGKNGVKLDRFAVPDRCCSGRMVTATIRVNDNTLVIVTLALGWVVGAGVPNMRMKLDRDAVICSRTREWVAHAGSGISAMIVFPSLSASTM